MIVIVLIIVIVVVVVIEFTEYGGFAVVNTTVVVVEKNIPVFFKTSTRFKLFPIKQQERERTITFVFIAV